VAAVGDVACAPGQPRTATRCKQAETAYWTRAYRPNAVIGLGDMQYEAGTLAEFTGSYDRFWGVLKPITRPVPGNHEYRTRGAAGYYAYFGGRHPGFYAWNIGNWRVYNLNSNCAYLACRRQLDWFRADLSRFHPGRCVLVAMHHPRFSSGLEHGSQPAMVPFWRVAYRYRVDIMLAGHDHDYERFTRLDPDGRIRRNGIQSFVSGAGGKSLYHMGTRKHGSQFFWSRSPGVLQLVLGAHDWAWRFQTVDGAIRDHGRAACL
jgi:hypothetical protein